MTSLDNDKTFSLANSQMWQHTFETLQRGVLFAVHEPERLTHWASEEEGFMYVSVYLSVVLAGLQLMKLSDC